VAGFLGGAGAGPGGFAAELNPADVARVRANLARFDRDVDLGMRATGQAWARALETALGRAARGAPSPQAHRFDGAAEVDDEDEAGSIGAVVVVNAEGAGFYNDSAVLQATERGSPLKCFDAPPGGRYWIDPTVRASEPLAVAAARRVTTVAVAKCNGGV